MNRDDHRLLDQVHLENGLTIFFYNASKPIAAGRFQVQLLAAVPIPAEQCSARAVEDSEELFEDFLRELGGELVFTVQKTRNFVDEKEMPRVLEGMKTDFLAANRGYLGHAEFARKYVRKRYLEWKTDQQWKGLHRDLIQTLDEEKES